MSFLVAKNHADGAGYRPQKPPFYKKRGWKVFFIFSGLVVIVGLSFAAYIFSAGSKVFQNGIGGKDLLKTIYGKEQLKGESDDRINVLLLGMGGPTHPGGMLSDSIIVLSIQPKEKKAAMISIPRDLLVPIPGYGDDKINSAFADGYNGYKCPKGVKDCRQQQLAAGATLSSTTVANSLGIPIHYYAYVDFNGFQKIIDQLGGVDIYVKESIYDATFPDENMKGYEPFSIKAGQHHLDGKTALKYARSRHTTSDFDRAKRQQEVIMAAKDKAMKAGFLANPKKVTDVISTIGDSVGVSFSPAELKAFIELMQQVSTSDAITKVFTTGPDGELTDFNNGTYYQKPKTGNFKVIQSIAQNIFSQTKTKEQEAAKVEVLNGSSTAGLASKLATTLRGAGLNITAVQNASSSYVKTVIYDYSGGSKKATLDYLKKGLKAEIITKSSKDGTADISIIIGSDYTVFSTK